VADPKTPNESLITLRTAGLQILQKTAALSHHKQQATAGAVVLFVLLQVFRQLVDPRGQNRDLDIGRTRVFIVDTHTFDDFRFLHIGCITAVAINNLIFSGVFDRYPSLKVACVEFHAGEAPSVYANIDYQYAREAAVDPEKTINKRFPSEYLRDNVFWGFEDDPVVVRAAEIYGKDNQLWGSDFPHHTTTYPHSAALLERLGKGMDPAVLRKVCRENANRLYKFV
jgi:predicted TIM-barrel fold metal-dependent hydrolase